MDSTGLAVAEEVLEHHGVKGMKWGIRRAIVGGRATGAPSGHATAKSADAAKAHDTAAKIKTGGTHAVSNQDLQHLVTRMNLEQQFSRLSSSATPTTLTGKGAKFAGDLLKNVAKEQVSNVVRKQVTKQVKNALKGK